MAGKRRAGKHRPIAQPLYSIEGNRTSWSGDVISPVWPWNEDGIAVDPADYSTLTQAAKASGYCSRCLMQLWMQCCSHKLTPAIRRRMQLPKLDAMYIAVVPPMMQARKAVQS